MTPFTNTFIQKLYYIFYEPMTSTCKWHYLGSHARFMKNTWNIKQLKDYWRNTTPLVILSPFFILWLLEDWDLQHRETQLTRVTLKPLYQALNVSERMSLSTTRFRHLRLKQRKIRDYASEMVDLSKVSQDIHRTGV